MRVRRKFNAVDLIKNFIKDSTGIADTMKKIYRFRNKLIIVQRWVRGWICVQMARMKVFMTMAERIRRRRQEEEDERNLRNEQQRLKSLGGEEALNNKYSKIINGIGMAETVGEIGVYRRRLNRIISASEFRVERARGKKEKRSSDVSHIHSRRRISLDQNTAALPTTRTRGKRGRKYEGKVGDTWGWHAWYRKMQSTEKTRHNYIELRYTLYTLYTLHTLYTPIYTIYPIYPIYSNLYTHYTS